MMTENQQEYANFIIRELVAEADNGHVRETSAVVLARQWIELENAARAAIRKAESSRQTVRGGDAMSPAKTCVVTLTGEDAQWLRGLIRWYYGTGDAQMRRVDNALAQALGEPRWTSSEQRRREEYIPQGESH